MCQNKSTQQIESELRKEKPMSEKMKNRIKKMNFQRQERRIIDKLSDNDKYIIELAGYRKDTLRGNYENLQRFTRGTQRSQYI